MHGFLGWNEHLAAHVTALLYRRQLVLEVDPGSASGNQALGQLEGIEDAAKASLGVGNNRQEVVNPALVFGAHALGPLNFIGADEGVVNPLDHGRNRINRIQRLVGVHGRRGVGVGGNLPAGEVDGFDARLGLLHRLTAGQGAEAADGLIIAVAIDHVPELPGAVAGEGVFALNRPAQPHHVFGGVPAFDVGPAWVGGPILLEVGDLLLAGRAHDAFPLFGSR